MCKTQLQFCWLTELAVSEYSEMDDVETASSVKFGYK